MNGFYVSMIFLGIILVIFSLVCIYLDKKKVFGLFKSYDAKKQELSEIVSEAEEMINELNRFSDYIVNQMDLKNEEMNQNLKMAEEKVNALNEKMRLVGNSSENIKNEEIKLREEMKSSVEMKSDKDIKSCIEMVSNEELIPREDIISQVSSSSKGKNAVEVIYNNHVDKVANVNFTEAAAVNGTTYVQNVQTVQPVQSASEAALARKGRDKVIPINKKHYEVMRLSNEGMQSLDIAKKLNMGKGEVELILGLRK